MSASRFWRKRVSKADRPVTARAQHSACDDLANMWFHGVLHREDAEEVLACKPVGSWLVRQNEDQGFLAISKIVHPVMEDNVHYSLDPTSKVFRHYKIFEDSERSSFYLSRKKPFPAVGQLIMHYMNHPYEDRESGPSFLPRSLMVSRSFELQPDGECQEDRTTILQPDGPNEGIFG